WQVQQSVGCTHRFLLWMKSADTLCLANNNGKAILRPCSPIHLDKLWIEVPANGGFLLQSADGPDYLCATGGIGSIDIVAPLSQCKNSYHDTWKFVP
ncbi:MAG TPA: hypothetical protein VGS19_37315, partial [Streptosporangiaceae bacterium]|nr:hypothetical protein [Streptosporangiaceae bacterium]